MAYVFCAVFQSLNPLTLAGFVLCPLQDSHQTTTEPLSQVNGIQYTHLVNGNLNTFIYRNITCGNLSLDSMDFGQFIVLEPNISALIIVVQFTEVPQN